MKGPTGLVQLLDEIASPASSAGSQSGCVIINDTSYKPVIQTVEKAGSGCLTKIR